MCFLLMRLGHPQPRKTCKLEQYLRMVLLCLLSEQRGLRTVKGKLLFQKSSHGHWHLFGSLDALRPSSDMYRSPEELCCAKLWSETSLHVCRLLQCRQKSLIKCHYKIKLSWLGCFLGWFSLLHRNAVPSLLHYLELLCRHFYRCTRDSFNTK